MNVKEFWPLHTSDGSRFLFRRDDRENLDPLTRTRSMGHDEEMEVVMDMRRGIRKHARIANFGTLDALLRGHVSLGGGPKPIREVHISRVEKMIDGIGSAAISSLSRSLSLLHPIPVGSEFQNRPPITVEGKMGYLGEIGCTGMGVTFCWMTERSG